MLCCELDFIAFSILSTCCLLLRVAYIHGKIAKLQTGNVYMRMDVCVYSILGKEREIERMCIGFG